MIERPWSGTTRRAHGRTQIQAACPFCGAPVTLYVWSLNGCGKKLCTCGAALCRDGIARKPEPEETP